MNFRFRPCVHGLCFAFALLALVAPRGFAQFMPTAAGAYDYNMTSNWVGGTINGVFSQTPAGSQTVNFGVDTTLLTGLTFSLGANQNLFLQGSGADRTLTLGGDIGVSGSATLVTIGSGVSGYQLAVNLGGADRTFTVGSSQTLRFLNPIGGSNALTVSGASGTTTLAGDNTYTGGTTISVGTTLAVGDGGSTGSILGNVANSGALIFNRTGTFSYSGVISGGGSVSKFGSSTLTLSGNNTYTGTTQISGGTLLLGVSGALASGNNVLMRPGSSTTAEFKLDNGVTQSIGTLNLGGQSTTSVSNVTLNTGSTLTLGGTVTFDATNNPGQSAINGAGTLDLGGNRTFNIGDSTTTNSELNIFTPITGTGSLTKTGAGRLAVNSNLTTYSGGTIVNGGEFWVNATDALASAGAVTINNTNSSKAHFILGDSYTQTIGALTFGGAGGTSSSVNILELHNAGSVLTLGGDVTVNATGNPTTAASITGLGRIDLGGNRIFNVGDSTGATPDLTVSAGISGTGFSLTKTGAGTLRLGNANTYTGGTIVSGGTLVVANDVNLSNGSATGTGAVTVQSGAILRSSGAGAAINGLATIQSGGILGSGNAVSVGSALAFAGGLTLNDGAVFNFRLGTSSDQFNLTGGVLTGATGPGTLTINLTAGSGFASGNYTLFDFTSASSVSSFDLSDFVIGTQISGYTSSLSMSGSTLQLTATAVPEPSTYAAIIAAASLVGTTLYRRRQARV